MPRFTQNNVGLVFALDVGIGETVELRWNEALSTEDGTDTIRYLIFEATNRIDVLSSEPKYIATATIARINRLSNNHIYYYMVRATELLESDYDVEELAASGTDLYRYPTTTLSVDISAADKIIPVASINGFPISGIITINSEAIQYSSVQQSPYPAFILTSITQRGVKDSSATIHYETADVKLYKGYMDNNTVVERAVPTINQDYNHNVDGYDGYTPRAVEDFVTTDFSIANSKINFSPFDYCGYHSTDPQAYFKGELCGTYVGGEFNGMRGFDMYDRNFARLEMMIQQTGEQCYLMQRKWSGEQCPCLTSHRNHAYKRCSTCYGTGFIGGYDVFFNPRNNRTGKIFVRFSAAEEDLIIEDKGLAQEYKPNAWTIPFPNIKAKDWIVRFDERGNELWRYEVLRATRNKLFYSFVGKQDLVLSRENKTDIIYQFPMPLL